MQKQRPGNCEESRNNQQIFISSEITSKYSFHRKRFFLSETTWATDSIMNKIRNQKPLSNLTVTAVSNARGQPGSWEPQEELEILRGFLRKSAANSFENEQTSPQEGNGVNKTQIKQKRTAGSRNKRLKKYLGVGHYQISKSDLHDPETMSYWKQNWR